MGEAIPGLDHGFVRLQTRRQGQHDGTQTIEDLRSRGPGSLVVGEHLLDHFSEFIRHPAQVGCDVLVGDLGQHLVDIARGTVGRMTGGGLHQHRSQTVDVGGRAGRLALSLFGGHGQGRADDQAGHTKPDVTIQFGDQSEVDQDRADGTEDDVRRLEVPVDQTFGVHLGQALGQHHAEKRGLVGRHRGSGQVLGQGPALHEGGDQVRLLQAGIGRKHPDQGFTLDLLEGGGLPGEPLQPIIQIDRCDGRQIKGFQRHPGPGRGHRVVDDSH